MTPLEKAANIYVNERYPAESWSEYHRNHNLVSYLAGAHFSAQHEQKRAEKLVEVMKAVVERYDLAVRGNPNASDLAKGVTTGNHHIIKQALKDYEASK